MHVSEAGGYWGREGGDQREGGVVSHHKFSSYFIKCLKSPDAQNGSIVLKTEILKALMFLYQNLFRLCFYLY